MTYSDKIKDVISESDVAIFMKGTPAFAMCGNSDRALQALRRAGASVTAIDVLPDPQIRQDLSSISVWPTIPQVFVKGELVGGADERCHVLQRPGVRAPGRQLAPEVVPVQVGELRRVLEVAGSVQVDRDHRAPLLGERPNLRRVHTNGQVLA